MGTQRTGAMTAIGVLNIFIGALSSLVFLLMIMGAGFMAAAGTAMGGQEGAAVAAGGGFLMLVGIAAFAVNLMLFISGIGVLKVAPWGRTLSIAAGGLGIVVYGASLIGSGISIPVFVALAYCVVLISMFFTPSWKAAFGGESAGMPASCMPAPPAPSELGQTSEASESEETRDAA